MLTFLKSLFKRKPKHWTSHLHLMPSQVVDRVMTLHHNDRVKAAQARYKNAPKQRVSLFCGWGEYSRRK